MKFEPFYAYNDRLVLFSDIKKENKPPKQNKQNPVPRAHISVGKLRGLQRRGKNGFNEAVCEREINF